MDRLAWPLRFVATVAAGALLLTGVVLGVAPRIWGVANAHEETAVELPEFQPLSQRTLVYDNANNVIAVFERENSQPIKLSQVPPPVIEALLAVEDTGYYSHKGVNLRGFFRALLSNFATDGPTQGASTITQQVVKNDFLAGLPRDGRYKALQAHYATMLEKTTTKDEILERYLNTVFFGNNAYGLQAASEVYFGKEVEQLTMLEGAFLAGLVRSPSGYDPINNPEPSRRRFAQVTERLAVTGMVTEAEAKTLGRDVAHPRTGAHGRHAHHQADVLHRRAARLPAEQVEHPRRHRAGAGQPALPRRPAHPHHLRPGVAGAGRDRPQDPARQHEGVRRRAAVRRDVHRCHPGDGRRARPAAERTRR